MSSALGRSWSDHILVSGGLIRVRFLRVMMHMLQLWNSISMNLLVALHVKMGEGEVLLLGLLNSSQLLGQHSSSRVRISSAIFSIGAVGLQRTRSRWLEAGLVVIYVEQSSAAVHIVGVSGDHHHFDLMVETVSQRSTTHLHPSKARRHLTGSASTFQEGPRDLESCC